MVSASNACGVSRLQRMYAPSPVREPNHRETPHELEAETITAFVQAFADAAWRLQQGHFDGCEVMASHCHLIDQFWTLNVNQRADEYGGDLPHRLRFGIRVLEAIRARCGDDFVIGIRITGDDFTKGGLNNDTMRQIAGQLDALGLLADRHPRAHVAIAGRGDAADALLARARELGLADRVSLLGLRADVPGLLMAADIFVLPSRSEGLPLALLEAMFAGCAIVATDVGEVRSVLADGEAGVVVPPENPVALAGALDRLLSNPTEARRLAAHARRRAQAEYDVSRMAARYAALYRVVLDRCSPANARSLDHSTTRG